MRMIFLTLSVLALSSCGDYKLKFVYVLDTKHMVCAQKQVLDTYPITFKHIADLSLDTCDGGVLISKDEFLPFKRWVEDAQKEYKDLKQKCGWTQEVANGI